MTLTGVFRSEAPSNFWHAALEWVHRGPRRDSGGMITPHPLSADETAPSPME
jgi:hypothetical protein